MVKHRKRAVVTTKWLEAAGAAADVTAAANAPDMTVLADEINVIGSDTPKTGEEHKEVFLLSQTPQTKNDDTESTGDLSQLTQTTPIATLRQLIPSSLPPWLVLSKKGNRRDDAMSQLTQTPIKPAGICPFCMAPQPDAASVSPAGAGHCLDCWLVAGRAIPLHRGAAV